MMRAIALLAAVAAVACGCGDSDSVDRLGCGAYCQNAGAMGGAPESPLQTPRVVVRTHGVVVPLPDGTVPLDLECTSPEPCKGALILRAPYGKVGRSDLLIDGQSSRTLGIPLKRSDKRLTVQLVVYELSGMLRATSQTELVLAAR
jgi:hypothetical protein